MAANEIAYVDPGLILLDDTNPKHSVRAGTIAVIPHITPEMHEEQDGVAVEPDENGEYHSPFLPKYTILGAGQELERSLYPELSPILAETGGFNHFIVPNLIKRFIIGIDSETDEILWGDGVVYYQSIPKPVVRQRDIRY